MIWLASYPRSGNTFVRNLLFEAFGIESSSYHHESYNVNSDFEEFKFVKTHLLPNELPEELFDKPSIYIVRDGRDSIVSMAHHRRDFVDPHSFLLQNMSESIIASNNSHFGGWAQNAYKWILKADLIIRFEDLIENPKREIQRIAEKFHLKVINNSIALGFQQQQSGNTKYGSNYDPFDANMPVKNFSQKFFRKGKVNNWKEEMPIELQALFWDNHGDLMEKIGYSKTGIRISLNEFDRKISILKNSKLPRPRRVLIEATKADEDFNDGVKRYVHTLLKCMTYARDTGTNPFDMKVKVFDTTLSLDEAVDIELKKVLKQKKKEKEKETEEERRKQDDLEILELIEQVEEEYNHNSISSYIQKLRSYHRQLPKPIANTITQIIKLTKIKVYYGRYRAKKIEGTFKKAVNYKFDLIHYTLPQILDAWEKGDEHLVTMHDITHLNFSEFHLQTNIDQAEKGFNKIRDKSPYLLSVSNSTFEDLENVNGFKDLQKKTIYEAVDHHHFHILYDQARINSTLNKFSIKNTDYILCLATNEPRKNIRNTILGYLQLIEKHEFANVKLVIGGKPGWKSEELVNHPNVIYTGYVLDEDLCVLYNCAVAFCYISHYEGFGLPPLEAMRCKTVPIYGNNSSMLELIGEYGLPTDPNDVSEIRNNMEYLVKNKAQRLKMESQAYDRSMNYSINKMAKNTLDYYCHILN